MPPPTQHSAVVTVTATLRRIASTSVQYSYCRQDIGTSIAPQCSALCRNSHTRLNGVLPASELHPSGWVCHKAALSVLVADEFPGRVQPWLHAMWRGHEGRAPCVHQAGTPASAAAWLLDAFEPKTARAGTQHTWPRLRVFAAVGKENGVP